MNKMVQCLKDEISNAPKLKKKLINNLTNKEHVKVVTNLLTIEFDFCKELVSIFYYVEDKAYPPAVLGVHEFSRLLEDG